MDAADDSLVPKPVVAVADARGVGCAVVAEEEIVFDGLFESGMLLIFELIEERGLPHFEHFFIDISIDGALLARLGALDDFGIEPGVISLPHSLHLAFFCDIISIQIVCIKNTIPFNTCNSRDEYINSMYICVCI